MVWWWWEGRRGGCRLNKAFQEKKVSIKRDELIYIFRDSTLLDDECTRSHSTSSHDTQFNRQCSEQDSIMFT
jgi:hypothetical protein